MQTKRNMGAPPIGALDKTLRDLRSRINNREQSLRSRAKWCRRQQIIVELRLLKKKFWSKLHEQLPFVPDEKLSQLRITDDGTIFQD